MVDWREVERLRAKGLDWDSIAESPKVGFTPPEGVEDSGRALKSLYLTRRSQRSRGSRSGAGGNGDDEGSAAVRPRGNRTLFFVGVVVTLLFGIWSVIAYAVPAPFGVIVPFYPYLVIGLIVGLILLGSSFILGVSGVRSRLFKPVVVGVVVGLVAVGASGGIAYLTGVPVLHPGTPIGFGWNKAAQNEVWKSNGLPVFMFVGAAACPYCSISSWSILAALKAYGSVSNVGVTTSSPTDVFANTPAVELYGITYTSSYISFDVWESTDNTQISIPALPSTENAYLQAYNPPPSTSIPFLVIGGQYYFVGSLLSPGNACLGGPGATTTSSSGSTQCSNGPYAPSTFSQVVQNSSSPVYSAVMQQSWLLEALLWKSLDAAGMTPPVTVSSDQNVINFYQQLS